MQKHAASITPAIVEDLYGEALCLAEDARSAFEGSGAVSSVSGRSNAPLAGALAGDVQIALSCEALRTTTRMMHALAWLLNHRAFLAGELSEFQLRRHGRLPQGQPPSDPVQFALLDPAIAQVVAQTSAFYARIERLDASWRLQGRAEDQPVMNLRARIGQSFAIGGA